MRRFLACSLLFALAGCATAPEPAPAPVQPVAPARPSGALIGLTASELVSRLGQPVFQVREGPAHKMQWSRGGCVLDAYLYPEGGRGDRATHFDARRPSGADLDLATCLSLIGR